MFLMFDAIRMIREIRGKGWGIRTWGALLNIPQLLGGLAFILFVEGQVIFVTIVFTLIVAGQIHKRSPFSRLTGLCHIPWVAMLPWLIYRLQVYEHLVYLKVWAYYVAVVVAISLVFDVIDIARYLRGERQFSWSEASK